MAIRNSHVTIYVDGRPKPVGTGPRTKDGKLDAQFTVRSDGAIARSVAVYTTVDGDNLCLYVQAPDGTIIYEQPTTR